MTSSSTIEVLYEDNHLICVFKPHRIPTQGDSTGDESLLESLKTFLKERESKPGNVFVGLLHRLDRPAAGVVLFAKTSKGASRLSEQFRSREVQKRYQAVVEGKPPATGHLVHELKSETGPKRAELKYRTLKEGVGSSLVEVELLTGRKHQIRQQMSLIGHPILGDRRYGAKTSFREGSIALVATELGFHHPVRREEWITIKLLKKLNSLNELCK